MRKFVICVAVVFIVLLFTSPQSTFSQSECSGTNLPQLTVGGYARVIQPESLEIMAGTAYEAGGLSKAEQLWQPTIDDVLLVVEGPVCYEGQNWWRIQPPLHPHIPYNSLDAFPDALWLSEAIDSEYLVVPTDAPPNNTPEITLGQTSAPIVNAALQINFTSGGGNEPPPCVGRLSNAQTTVNYSNVGDRQACLLLGFPVTSASTIRVFHEGRLYLEMQGEDGMEYWMIPVQQEFPMGIWQAEFTDNETTHTIAYQLSPGISQSLLGLCEEFYPILYFSGFEPNREVEFIQVLASEYHPTRKDGTVLKAEQIEQTYLEPVGDEGDLMAYYGAILGQQRFFIIKETLEWTYGGLFAEYPLACAVPASLEDAKTVPVTAGKLISGSLGGTNPDPIFYAFEGKAGQQVTISVVALDNSFDPIVQLYDPDDALLAENDDAQPALFGELNSQIADFVLAQDGLYSIAISRVSPESGAYVLLIE